MRDVKVLIVEDDPMVADINKRLVGKIPPFKVTGISTTEEDALFKIETQKPHLVLLDVYLNDGNGISLLKKIRNLEIPCDVILVTAAKDTQTIRRSLHYGATDYIIKPFNFQRLRDSLKKYYQLNILLNENKDLTQFSLDSQQGTSGPPSVKADKDGVNESAPTAQDQQSNILPKGISEITLNKIINFLEQSQAALSSDVIGNELSMSKITIWRYVEYLAAEGKVDVELEYGTVGRPIKSYRIRN